MNTLKKTLCLLTILSSFNACDLNDKITEEQAKAAGNYMLSLKNQENGGADKMKFIKWKAFIVSGDTKAELWGVFQAEKDTTCVMSGAFNFMKPKDGDWTLSNYDFHGEHGAPCIWSKEFIRYKIPR